MTEKTAEEMYNNWTECSADLASMQPKAPWVLDGPINWDAVEAVEKRMKASTGIYDAAAGFRSPSASEQQSPLGSSGQPCPTQPGEQKER